jgi:hypothetical protein
MTTPLLLDISATTATIIVALVGFGGAIVGGAATVFGQSMNDQAQKKKSAADSLQLAAATALLIQDDYLHYEATLARSLDRWTWWKPAELLDAQASTADRKTVWGKLDDDKRWVVAAAQGWMDYLIQCRKLQPPGETPPLSLEDGHTMRQTFCDLEQARQTLQSLTGPNRDFIPFGESGVGVIAQLTRLKSLEAIEQAEPPENLPERSIFPIRPHASLAEEPPSDRSGNWREAVLDLIGQLLPQASDRDPALAILRDEVGACARGELPLPDREQLAEWLGLLNRVAGSDRPND